MSFEIDQESLLVNVPGAATLASIERALSSTRADGGFTLGIGVAGETSSVAEWLAAGAPGAPSMFSDPADHLVAGLSATLANGKTLEIRPSPRRAVGPDLIALFVSANGRFGTIDRVWLRIHRKDALCRVSLPLRGLDLDAPVSVEESALLDRIAHALRESREPRE